MEHLLLKAATTAADQGTFEAVISTVNVDREGDVVEPSAMVNALAKWARLGKRVPLAWNHTEEVIGHIDPMSVRVEDDEVIAKGWVDQSTPRGEEAWRLVKSGTFSFSFGYMIPKNGATKLAGGRYRIKEMDIFEISGVPIAPANNDTRVLGWKSAETAESEAPEAPEAPAEPTREQQLETELEEVKGQLAKALDDLKTAEETGKEPEARPVDPLRKQAESTALEFASDGLSLQKPPRKVEQPKPEPELSLQELKQRTRDELLMHLSGETI